MIWTIVVAAGHGSRFGRPKQYERLGDRRVLDWSVAAAAAVGDGVVLVVPPDRAADHAEHAEVDAVVAGGTTRSASVRAGLSATPPAATTVVVHDAARPLASPALFAAVIDAVAAGAAAAVPGLPVTDTVKEVDPDTGRVVTIDRSRLVTVQTPQAFASAWLRKVHEGEPQATDDAGLIEAAGGSVVVVPGDPINLKITHPHDLTVAAALLAEVGR